MGLTMAQELMEAARKAEEAKQALWEARKKESSYVGSIIVFHYKDMGNSVNRVGIIQKIDFQEGRVYLYSPKLDSNEVIYRDLDRINYDIIPADTIKDMAALLGDKENEESR